MSQHSSTTRTPTAENKRRLMISRIICASVLLASFSSTPAASQEELPDSASSAPASTERERLLTSQDVYLAAGFAAVTLASYPLDKAVAQEFQDSTVQAVDFARGAAKLLSAGGSSSVWLAGSAALYALGRVAGSQQVAETGLHTAESVLVSTTLTLMIKSIAGRARPFLGVDAPHDFGLGRGWGDDDYQSFPSGHTTGSFAAAAAITSEVNRHWPSKVWLVGPAVYGTATLVGLSRMYNNEHWASDVAVGAAIGVFSGLKVVSYNHSRPDDRLERWLIPRSMLPNDQGGVSLRWRVAK